MPKISKIRIAGLYYDDFLKKHEDTLLDLTTDKGANHALATFKNGGGKGVIMQCMAQVLNPGVSWGKNDGNKVESFFYQNGRIIPYTFHVLLEWELDTEAKNHIWTGICMTIVQRVSEEDEENTRLRYFTYIGEKEKISIHSFESIPLYDKERNQGTFYEDMENFIKKNNKYFTFHSKYQIEGYNSKYKKILKEYHIYPEEWKTLKDINRDEGGVGQYFKDGDTNRKLFEQKIIPTIIENMNLKNPEEKGALIDIFKSSAKIAQNLPILLSRYEDYTIVENQLNPLYQLMEKGVSRKERYKRLIKKGNDLFYTFEQGLEVYDKEISKWQKEVEKTEKEEQGLLYRLKSIDYTKHYREKETSEKKLKEVTTNLNNLEKQKQNIKEKLHIYDITKYVFQKQEEVIRKEIKENELKYLEKDLKTSDIQEEIENTENNIRKNWEEKSSEIEKIIKKYQGYNIFLNEEINECTNKIKQMKDTREGIQNDVNKFENKKEVFEYERSKISNWYDSMRIQMLDILFEEETKDYNEFEKNMFKREKEIDKISNEFEKNAKGLIENKLILENIQKEGKKLEESYKATKEEEEKIHKQIIYLCQIENESYSKQWLQSMKDVAKNQIEDKRIKQKQINEEKWKINLDISINKEDYWIPNQDILKVKEKIENLDIKAQLGMEYLSILPKDEAKKLLEEVPYLPFSILVLNEEDYKRIKRQLTMEEIQHSPILIYNMENKDEKNVVKSILGGEKKFIYKEKFIKWKETLSEKHEKYTELFCDFEDKEKKLQKLYNSVDNLLQKESSAELHEKVKAIIEKKQKLEQKILELSEVINNLKQQKEAINNKIKELKEDFQKSKERKEKVCNLYEQEQEIMKLLKEVNEKKKNIKNLRIQEDILEKQKNDLEGQIRQQDRDYDSWIREGKDVFTKIQRVIKDINFPKVKNFSEISIMPRYFIWENSEIVQSYNKWTNLNVSIEQQNIQMKNLRMNIKEIDIRINKIEDELYDIDKNWKEAKIEKISLSELNLFIKNEKIKSEETQNKINEVLQKKAILGQKISDEEKHIKKYNDEIFLEYGKIPQLFEGDLNRLQYGFQEEIKEKENYKIDSKKTIKENNEKKLRLEELKKHIAVEENIDKNNGVAMKYVILKETYEQTYRKWRVDLEEIKKVMLSQMNEVNNGVNYVKKAFCHLKEEHLKNEILEKITDMNINNFEENRDMLRSIIEWCRHEKERSEEEKNEAEHARDRWVDRATRQVLTISSSIKEMTRKMQVKNEMDENFPLVRLKDPKALPKEEEIDSIRLYLKEYFIECIEKLKEEELNIDSMSKKVLNQKISPSIIFRRSLRGDYPEFQVYKMTERKEFMYESPQSRHYVSWQAIQKGEGYTPQGSGGQTLSINTFMMMMLLNYRKRPLYGKMPYTILLMDNPFGKASDDHVLDPIFMIADKLHFQIIAFAAPNIIKPEISERFPVFWNLKVATDKEDGEIGTVLGKIRYGARVWNS